MCGLSKDMEAELPRWPRPGRRHDAKFTGDRDNAVRDHKDPLEHSISIHLFKGN